ncbi:terminase small subunit [Hymenobacter sp. GOD-10R]|uniref:terminase small subunit n=1 Tax=Hymenobacter sp. GOD-10R TaxID=3093922 RepID=UPI003A5CE787
MRVRVLLSKRILAFDSENKTKAALLAGYATSGAGQEAHRLLRIANVRAAVDERMGAFGMSAEKVVQRMSEAASILLN